ncbi:hypothetical protein [Spongiibacter sp.]|uniref:hypothetical protein n=1 Tax=Spongiibacter sp. TaxID=2024860 RepID=UPI00257AD014|nr:hypothetical protein [Spongiibacter sp.]
MAAVDFTRCIFDGGLNASAGKGRANLDVRVTDCRINGLTGSFVFDSINELVNELGGECDSDHDKEITTNSAFLWGGVFGKYLNAAFGACAQRAICISHAARGHRHKVFVHLVGPIFGICVGSYQQNQKKEWRANHISTYPLVCCWWVIKPQGFLVVNDWAFA